MLWHRRMFAHSAAKRSDGVKKEPQLCWQGGQNRGQTNRDKLLRKAPVADQAAKRVRRGRYQGARLHEFPYFHQEYVSTFRSTGEFRVWVCSEQVVCASGPRMTTTRLANQWHYENSTWTITATSTGIPPIRVP